MMPTAVFTFQNLQKTLNDLNIEGGFEITVLTDQNGLPIASSAGDSDEIDMQAAVVSKVEKIISQIKPQLGMAATDEIALNDVNGKKLICRSFVVGDGEMTLAILINSRNKTYRRLTNKVIIQIQQMTGL